MTPYNPQEIEERFERLPEPLKEAMLGVENSECIFEVGKKFGLTIEQIGFLAEEAGYVVLGLTHPKDFVGRLAQHLRVDDTKAKALAQAINHQVFFPLREILKNTHQFELTQEQIHEPSLPIPPIPRPQASPAQPIPKPTAPAAVPAPPIPLPKPTPPPSSPPPSTIIQPPAQLAQTPVQQQAPSPLNPLPSSTIQEKKTEALTIPPPTIATSKSIEGIRSKELLPAATNKTQTPAMQTPVSETPLAPSQIMQQKLLEERQRAPSPVKSQTERIKESLFAPPSTPSAPVQTTPTPSPQPPSAPPAPPVSPQPSIPSSYSGSDPYREPLE